MPVLREASIQSSVVRYARQKGAIAIKLSTMGPMGTSGWPDYLFLYKEKLIFMEFKRPGGKPTPLQVNRAQLLISHGFSVWMIDNVNEGKAGLRFEFGWEE